MKTSGAERGAVAIEFALLAPLLLAALAGAVEFGDIAFADRRAAGAADSVARLANREHVSADDLDALQGIAEALVLRGRAQQVGLAISGLAIDDDGNVHEQWRRSWGGVQPPLMPPGFSAQGTDRSVVLVRLVYRAKARIELFTNPEEPREAIAMAIMNREF